MNIGPDTVELSPYCISNSPFSLALVDEAVELYFVLDEHVESVHWAEGTQRSAEPAF